MPHELHRNGGQNRYSFDTDDVDKWLTENGYSEKKKRRRRGSGQYITIHQAKNLFPQNPAMALLYAIFCTKEDYLKMFRA